MKVQSKVQYSATALCHLHLPFFIRRVTLYQRRYHSKVPMPSGNSLHGTHIRSHQKSGLKRNLKKE